MTWHFLLQKLVTWPKLPSVTHSYEKVLLCFFSLLWGFFSVIHFSLEVLLGLISSLIFSAGFRKVPVFIFHLDLLLFTSQMLTDVVMRDSLAVFFLQRMLIFKFFFCGFIDSMLVGVHNRTHTRDSGQDLHGVPRSFEKTSSSLTKLLTGKTFHKWKLVGKESRSRCLLCKCGETLSERLLNRGKIRRGWADVLACPQLQESCLWEMGYGDNFALVTE